MNERKSIRSDNFTFEEADEEISSSRDSLPSSHNFKPGILLQAGAFAICILIVSTPLDLIIVRV